MGSEVSLDTLRAGTNRRAVSQDGNANSGFSLQWDNSSH